MEQNALQVVKDAENYFGSTFVTNIAFRKHMLDLWSHKIMFQQPCLVNCADKNDFHEIHVYLLDVAGIVEKAFRRNGAPNEFITEFTNQYAVSNSHPEPNLVVATFSFNFVKTGKVPSQMCFHVNSIDLRQYSC